MSLPLELSYTKRVTYLGKLEEHVVILAIVFFLDNISVLFNENYFV
jgi:hypothetical protein